MFRILWLVLIFSFAIMAFTPTTFSQSWDNTGITWNTNVHDMSVGRAFGADLTIYFAQGSFIYRSTNGSGSWGTTAEPEGTVLALTCKPDDPLILLVAMDTKVRRSTNGGMTWVSPDPISNVAALHPLRLATSPVSSERMYLGLQKVSGNSSMRRSTNGGSAWRNDIIYFSGGVQTDVTCFGTHPNDGLKVWAGGKDPAALDSWSNYTTTRSNGVFFSTDGGANWDTCGSLRKNIVAMSVAYSLGTTEIIVGTSDNELYTTTNNGVTWQLDGYYPGGQVKDLDYILPNFGYVAAANGVFYEGGGPLYWGEVTNGVYGIPNRIKVDPLYSSNIYVGSTSNLFKSTDDGATWIETTVGPAFSAIGMNDGKILSFSPTSSHVKLFDGSSWSSVATLSNFNGSIGYKSTSNATAFATGYLTVSGTNRASICRSTDSGNSTWSEVDAGSGTGVYKGFLVDPLDANRIFVYGSRTSSQNIRVSLNGGGSFGEDVSFLVGGVAPQVCTMIADPTGGSTQSNYVYAGVSTGNSSYDGVWKSTNAGASWSRLASSSVYQKKIIALAINPSNPSIIYAADSTTPALLKTTNGGTNWTTISGISGAVSRIVMNPANVASKTDIFVLLANGTKVYRSRNAGITWEDITFGLPTPITDLNGDRANPYKLGVATGQGVFTLLLTPVPSTGTITTSVMNNWNMLSIPNVVANFDSNAVYPSPPRNSNVFVYTDGIGYTAVNPLSYGIGYWVRFNSATTVSHTGDSIKSMWVPVKSSWNIAGTITEKIRIGSIQTQPADNRASAFYKFTGAYVALTDNDSLEAGKGYWVKFTSDGVMNLRGSQTVGLGRPGSNDGFETYDRFTITDANGRVQNLYVCNADLPGTPDDMEMPPPPPEPEFYAHFESGHYLRAVHADSEDVVLDITVEEASYPVTLSYEINPDNGITYSFAGTGGLGRSSGNMSLSDGEHIFHLTAKAVHPKAQSKLPDAFALHQNYPNPFNPSTALRFSLPEPGIVSLVVYDMLGREIATVVSGYLDAGYHSAAWNASKQASGVYFARLTVKGENGRSLFTKVNKLVLTK